SQTRRWIGFSEYDDNKKPPKAQIVRQQSCIAANALRTPRSTLASSLQCSTATDEQAHNKIDHNCRRDRNQERADERWPERRPHHSRKNMPVHVIVETGLAEMHALGCWPVQDPRSHMILGDIQRGHCPNHYVVQRHSNGSSDFIAAA